MELTAHEGRTQSIPNEENADPFQEDIELVMMKASTSAYTNALQACTCGWKGLHINRAHRLLERETSSACWTILLDQEREREHEIRRDKTRTRVKT